VEGKNDIDNAK